MGNQHKFPKSIQKVSDIEQDIKALLNKMTVKHKIGQLQQITYSDQSLSQQIINKIINGEVGSFFNCYDVNIINQMQKLSAQKSVLGIPLLIARDVIHGYRTVLPIPLAQAASFNPDLVTQGARIAAIQASSCGIRWTFSPMVDIARDPRWGRIAQGCGQDPYLASIIGTAVVKGYQTNNLKDITAIAACAKHYVGYGAAEGGKDYNTTLIPENTLRDIYLTPFKAVVQSGIQSIMSAFNDLNGIPSSANQFTLKQVLRNQWGFDGLVVSDYTSVQEMIIHGYCQNFKDAALKGFNSGINMEMVSTCFFDNLQSLIKQNKVKIDDLDIAVSNILRIKFRLGLFQNPYTDPSRQSIILDPKHLKIAQNLATQCPVLLENKNNRLPISKFIKNLAIIGPLADDKQNQLGCNVADGRSEDCITPYTSLKEILNNTKIKYSQGLPTCRSTDTSLFPQAIDAANSSDLVLLFLGEDNGLTGQSCSRAVINLPGCQELLVQQLYKTGKPLILILYGGRPITISNTLKYFDSVLFVWHLGIMSGPAIADLILGNKVPSGRLPITYVRQQGQIPTYYNKKNTGRPNNTHEYIDSTSCYIDIDTTPLYPFGYGLSYTTFNYSQLSLTKSKLLLGESMLVSVRVTNLGNIEASEVIMLFVKDWYGSYTRPVKQLKNFKKINFKGNQSQQVIFVLKSDDLRFWTKQNKFDAEPGKFSVFVGRNSEQFLSADFELIVQTQNFKQQVFELIQ